MTVLARRVLCRTVILSAALGIPAGYAHAATSGPSCSDGNLAAVSLSGSPTAVKAGAPIIDSTRLTNTTSAKLSNASFILALIPPSDHGGNGTPELSWRVDGGAWHAFGLTWSAPSGSGADWQSTVQFFGSSFAPKASHTLDIRTEFTTASPSGDYQYDLAYSADPCGMGELGMNLEFSHYAQGWTQPHPQPSPTTHRPTTPTSTRAAAPTSAAAVTTTTAPATPTRAASPSPTPTGSASTTAAPALASAPGTRTPAGTLTEVQPAAASRPNHVTALVFGALAAFALLGGGLYAGRRHRREKTES